MHSYTRNKNFFGEVNWVHQALRREKIEIKKRESVISLRYENTIGFLHECEVLKS